MRVLIANRGEIALRILRSCQELDMETVGVYSEGDSELIHLRLTGGNICIGPAPSPQSYLNMASIVSAAELSGATAIHPGYGFLSENGKFAQILEQTDIAFVGPSSKVISIMGDKINAKQAMSRAGIPVVPGSEGAIANVKEAEKIADEMGYPVIIKASAGGGGRGMRVIRTTAEMREAFELTRNEAKTAFGDDTLYMEKFLERPRHVEIQVLADGHGNAIHLSNRDCSMQRRHQKVVEEGPAPGIDPKQRERVEQACVKACKQIGYQGAGTFEFLYEDEQFYFIEMNTRVQVEHPISEMICGVDIVREQLRIAQGLPLSVTQEQIQATGHAIECRINAEDPETMMPSPGRVDFYHAPGGNGVRVDSHLYTGYTVPPYYDSLIGKIIVWGETREVAIQRMKNALSETLISGIKTNIPLHLRILEDPDFVKGGANIHHLEKMLSINN